MTEKIYIRPKAITAKLDFLMDALDIEFDEEEDLEKEDIYSPHDEQTEE